MPGYGPPRIEDLQDAGAQTAHRTRSAGATPCRLLPFSGRSHGIDMGKLRSPRGRAAFYRLQAELARGKAFTMTDVRARDIMLEVAQTLDRLAEIEDRITNAAPQDKEP